MSDSLSSTSESSRSDVSREEQTTTRGVRGGAGGVASLIRAAKQQSGGLGALDKVSKDARIERCVSTIESSGVSPVKPNRNTRRLNSVPDQFTPDPNEINGDISRKVPLHPPSAVTNQTHTGDVESPPPPPKPPRQRRSASRSEFASVGEEEEEEEDEEFAAGIMGCEGNGVDDREEMEGSSEYVEQAMSSQSSNGSVTAQYQVTDPPGTRTLVAESPSVKRPMLPPSGKSRDVGSDRTPSVSPANARKENRTPSSSPAHVSSESHTPSSSPANARKGRSASPRKERSKSPTKAGSESPSRPSRKKEMSKSPKDNKSPKIPLIPPSSTKAKTPPTPTRTTPPYKRSPKSGRPPPKPVPYATRHSREPSAEEEDFTSHSNSGSVSQSNPTSHSGSMSHSGTAPHSEDKDLKEENERLKQQLRMLQLQLESSNKMTLSQDDQPGNLGGRGSVLTDPLAPDDSVFRSRSQSVSPGFDEERDHFPSGSNPRSVAQVSTKPVPLPRTRAQTMSANSPQRKPLAPPVSAFSPSFSVPATVGFVTPGGATTGSREREKAKPKVPILPPGSGSPIPKPRRQILSSGSAEPVKKSATNHVVLGSPLKTRRKSDEAVSANVKKPILPVAKAGTRGEVKGGGIKGEVKGGINGEVKGEVKGDREVEVQAKAAPKQVEADKTKAVLTLSKLLPSVPPSANKHVPPPLVPPIKPEGSDGLRVTSSVITPSPKSVSPQTVSPAVTQSHASKSIPIPRNIGTTTTTPQSWVPRNSKLSESDNYRTGISESQPVSSPLSSSVPPPVLTEKKGVTSKPVQVKAPLNSVAKPVPSVAGRAKYKKVTLTDTSWIKRKESLGTDSCDSVPSTPNDPAPETPTTAAVPRYVAPAVLPYGASPSPTPVRSDSNSSNASRSGSASSTSRYSSASNPATPSAVSSAPFRSHPILPGPKPVQQAFIPPSPEPPSGKATPTKPPPPKVPDTVSAPPAKRRWLKTPSDGEKKAQRRHSFTRNTSNDDTATPLPSELKAKSKGGRWGRKALSNSQVLDSPKGGKGRPVSMMVETERKSDFTASASLPRGMQPEDGIRQQKSGRRAPMLASLQEEDVVEKPKGSPSKQKKSSGLLGRFKNKTTVQKSHSGHSTAMAGATVAGIVVMVSLLLTTWFGVLLKFLHDLCKGKEETERIRAGEETKRRKEEEETKRKTEEEETKRKREEEKTKRIIKQESEITTECTVTKRVTVKKKGGEDESQLPPQPQDDAIEQ